MKKNKLQYLKTEEAFVRAVFYFNYGYLDCLHMPYDKLKHKYEWFIQQDKIIEAFKNKTIRNFLYLNSEDFRIKTIFQKNGFFYRSRIFNNVSNLVEDMDKLCLPFNKINLEVCYE